MTALGENVFRIGLRRFAISPSKEYIFSQLAVTIYLLLAEFEVRTVSYGPSGKNEDP